MGLEKVGAAVGKEIIAWARTSGKGLIATKPEKLSTSIGKHKIPRYLYHFTSKRNYENILSSGTINPNHDPFAGNGVFFVELENLFKEWNKVDKNKGRNLLEALLHHCGHRKDLVLLKIPVSKLDINHLRIRSQKKLFATMKNISEKELIEQIKILKKYTSGNQCEFDAMLNVIKEKWGIKVAEHLTKGDSAKYSKLYKQRKEAIEYIYDKPIDIKNIEKVGETSGYDIKQEKYSVKNVFEMLLNGTKEQRSLINLNV